jgi:hypothetical protein
MDAVVLGFDLAALFGMGVRPRPPGSAARLGLSGSDQSGEKTT